MYLLRLKSELYFIQSSPIYIYIYKIGAQMETTRALAMWTKKQKQKLESYMHTIRMCESVLGSLFFVVVVLNWTCVHQPSRTACVAI